MRRAALGSLIVLAGCGGRAIVAVDADAGDPPSGTSSSSSSSGTSGSSASPPIDGSAGAPSCESRGGLCLPPYSTPGGPPVRTPSKNPCPSDGVCWVVVATPGVAACKADQDCNELASTSSTMHTCFEGVCVCKAPFHVRADGKCAKTDPDDCASTVGAGRCVTNGGKCAAGELRGSLFADMSCGDFQPAICCVPICKAPVDLVCCGASTTPEEPRCVSGWLTCEGLQPALRSKGCF